MTTLFNYIFLRNDDSSAALNYGTSELIWAANIIAEAPPSGYERPDYVAMLVSLLPAGAAWPRDPDAVLQLVLSSLANELSKVDDRATALLVENDPRSTVELIEDWERVFNLPDSCVVNTTLSVQERRAAIEARMTTVGGQSKAFFIEYAFRLGYTITIDEFFPYFEGEELINEGMEYTWRINAPGLTVRDFRVGDSTVGEDLRTWGNEPLECAMNKLKPAHTVLLFGYDE